MNGIENIILIRNKDCIAFQKIAEGIDEIDFNTLLEYKVNNKVTLFTYYSALKNIETLNTFPYIILETNDNGMLYRLRTPESKLAITIKTFLKEYLNEEEYLNVLNNVSYKFI